MRYGEETDKFWWSQDHSTRSYQKTRCSRRSQKRNIRRERKTDKRRKKKYATSNKAFRFAPRLNKNIGACGARRGATIEAMGYGHKITLLSKCFNEREQPH